MFTKTLSRWLNKYNKDGNIKNKQKDSIAYKVKKLHVDFILNELMLNKTITTNELKNRLYEKFNFVLSRVHISRIIKDNNITFKNVKLKHEPTKRYGKDINIKDSLDIFYKNVKKCNINDIICIDETSISLNPCRSRGYSKIGNKCVIKTHSQDVFKKYTGIFSISVNAVLGYKIYDRGGITSDRLIKFLNDILSNFKNKIIILDNASSHRNIKVKEFINLNNKILYSVPYQSYTNAIENFFSILKSKLSKLSVLSYLNLSSDINTIIKSISINTLSNILNGAYNRDENYKQKKSKKRTIIKKYIE